MDERYSELVARISRTYGLQARDVERRVEARHALFSGLLSKRAAARIVSAQTRIEHLLGARHVTGLAVTDAVAAARAEANRGHASTLGYWCHPDEAAPLIASHYLRAIDDSGFIDRLYAS